MPTSVRTVVSFLLENKFEIQYSSYTELAPQVYGIVILKHKNIFVQVINMMSGITVLAESDTIPMTTIIERKSYFSRTDLVFILNTLVIRFGYQLN